MLLADALRDLDDFGITGENVVNMSDESYKAFAESLGWPSDIMMKVLDNFGGAKKTPLDPNAARIMELEKQVAALKAEKEQLNEVVRTKEEKERAEGEAFRIKLTILQTYNKQSFPSILRYYSDITRLGLMQVCFVMDGTASMKRCIEQVKTSIVGIAKKIEAATLASTTFALVVYRDYEDSNPYETFPFKSADTLATTLTGIKAIGGGDECEDCFGGLKKAFELEWATPGRLVIWIGDAPQHGRKYNGGADDSHPDKADITGNQLAQLAKDNACKLTFIKLNDSTDTMISVLQKEFEANGSKLLMIEEKICTAIESTLMTSATDTAKRTDWGGALREFALDPSAGYGDETKVKVISASAIPFNKDIHPLDALLIDYPLCAEENIPVTLATAPFAKGEMRYAYMCKRPSGRFYSKWSSSGKWVAKIPISMGTKMSKVQMRMQTIACFLAKEFTVRIRDSGLGVHRKVDYIPVQLMKLEGELWMLEPYIEGDYIKFNNNSGSVMMEHLADHPIPQALSHFSYYYSGGNLLLCDIQGVVSSDGYILTDPAIHTCNFELLRDLTNFSENGIAMFFKTHVCNKYCKFLNLPEFTAGAPISPFPKGTVEADHKVE